MRGARPSPGWFSFVALAASLSGGPALASGDKALGEYLSSECTACHQTSGRQVGGIPAIVGHPADQFLALMDAYRSKHRENQIMQTIAARLSREELLALAAYYESLKPAP
jgi:cytochrome c553